MSVLRTLTGCVLILMLQLPLSASAAPMNKGTKWGVFTGVQMDVGPGRDVGERAIGMMGAAMGPELGLHYWFEDWLALEGAVLYQPGNHSYIDQEQSFNFSSTALRFRVGARAALAKPLSPHLSLGLGYDRFRNDWEPVGDKLDSLIGTIETGLSYGWSQWSLGVHIGLALPIFMEAEVLDADVEPSAATGNIGARLGYSF